MNRKIWIRYVSCPWDAMKYYIRKYLRRPSDKDFNERIEKVFFQFGYLNSRNESTTRFLIVLFAYLSKWTVFTALIFNLGMWIVLYVELDIPTANILNLGYLSSFYKIETPPTITIVHAAKYGSCQSSQTIRRIKAAMKYYSWCDLS